MKLVFVTTAFHPYKCGVANYLKALTEELSKDNEVIVYTIDHEDNKYKVLKYGNVTVKTFPFKAVTYGFKLSPMMITEIGKDKPDLIHSNHYGFYQSVAAMKAAKKYKIPYVYSLYYHPPIYNMFKRILFWGFYAVWGRSTITNAKKIFACSNKEKDLLVKLGAKNVEVVPLIVDTKNYVYKERTDRRIKTITYASHFEWWKGANQFLGIASNLLAKREDCKFIFRSNFKQDPITDYLMKMYSDRFICMKESLDEPKLAELFQDTDILVCPSYYESFGITNAEAMACGSTVVATKQGAIPEVVVDGKFGLLSDYGDHAKMIEQVEYLLDHPHERIKMGKDASEYVHANYSAEKVASKLEETYKTFK